MFMFNLLHVMNDRDGFLSILHVNLVNKIHDYSLNKIKRNNEGRNCHQFMHIKLVFTAQNICKNFCQFL